AATRVIALYKRHLDSTGEEGVDPVQLRKSDAAERTLRLAGLQAERNEIFHMARHLRISDEMSRKLVREIDLAESRYR
ncbi:MAG: Na+/H+ antiporter, partial [Rhodanobacter sp.]